MDCCVPGQAVQLWTGCHVCLACRIATELGGDLGWLLNEVQTKGRAPVRYEMWYVGHTAPREYGSRTFMR